MLLFCLLVLPLAVISFYPTNAGDYDIWFHLAYGRHYVENLTFKIDHSQFSWTNANPDWQYGTWLGSTFLYLAYLLAGIPGLYALQWLCLGGIIVFFCIYLRVIREPLNLTHIFSFLLIATTIKLVALFVKPEMFSTLLFTIAAFFYFYAKTSDKSRVLLLYPLLFLLWVNTHGAFIIGLFMVSLLLGMETISFLLLPRQSSGKRHLQFLAVGVVLSYPVLLINPSGVEYPWAIFMSLFHTSPELEHHYEIVHAYKNLWQYLDLGTMLSTWRLSAWGMAFMGFTFAALSFYAWVARRTLDFSIIVLNLAFFALGMKMARAVLFFPIIWFFSVQYLFWKIDSIEIKKRLAVPSLVLFLSLAVWVFYGTLFYLDNRSWFGANLEEGLPSGASQFVLNNDLPGPIFNDYLIGGYLMWSIYPKYKVFSDSRWGPYAGAESQRDFDNIGKWLKIEKVKEFTAKYNFKVAILHMTYKQIIFWLLSDPEWRMVYFDAVGVVLIHESVVPNLSPEALNTDVSPSRFANLHNPNVIINLFNFYVNVHPDFGVQMRNIYEKNVTNWFKGKQTQLKRMDQAIQQKRQSLAGS
ncbi:MAG: hypothetical protein C4519_18340 [Desulfobacteraceae bacterium]|nr:MAG: hypothetical protein C4519_18340 [Desulfobacteraceae bacterium]